MKPISHFVLVAAALILAACGGAAGPSTSIDVVFTDFTFTPNSFVIPAGQEITITAVNNGAVVHNFVIMKLGTRVEGDFADDDEANIYWAVEVDPGGSKSVTFTAPSDAGEYQIVCRTQGHVIAGMIGDLTVVLP